MADNEGEKKMTRRIFAAWLGLLAGLATAPLAPVAWPVALAWFAANEVEESS